MSKANRNRGHNLERWVVNLFNSLNIFTKEIVTTRSCNRRLDDKKVDICFEDATKMPFNVQCKSSKIRPNYVEILNEMPDGNNIIIHENVVKKGSRFYKKKKYVIMELDFFVELIKEPHDAYENGAGEAANGILKEI